MTAPGASRPPADTTPPAEAPPLLRGIPAVHRLVDAVTARNAAGETPRPLVVEAARAVLDEQREKLVQPSGAGQTDSMETLIERVARRVEHAERAVLEPVINATGIIIHTGLGRAPLAASAARAAAEVASHYAPVEIDLATGRRGARSNIVRALLCELTGAESATVVNNNAAALMLTLQALAPGRSVIVSRGELIEIGGSFRLPDVMSASGAVLREVGTTNRTRIGDYEQAIDETTAALLKVHCSNYRVVGFTESVSIAELAALGRRAGLPVIDDIGSGALRPTEAYGWASEEPSAAASIRAGADLVLFSGDKLLGGPQAGVIVGRAALVERIERHPVMRALRVDKITLAALGATLQLHRVPEQAAKAIPVLALRAATVEAIRARAQALVERVGSLGEAQVLETSAYVGGGSLPEEAVPSAAVALRPGEGDAQALARRLRAGRPAVMGRVRGDAVCLDLRTVLPGQDEALFQAIRAALGCPGVPGGVS